MVISPIRWDHRIHCLLVTEYKTNANNTEGERTNHCFNSSYWSEVVDLCNVSLSFTKFDVV